LIHFAENGLLISGKLIAGAVARSGTESSNPLPSSGESRANLTSFDRGAENIAERDSVTHYAQL